MFLFIGGIGPRTKRLQHVNKPCPNCHNPVTTIERTDQVVNIFFVPIFRAKKGVPFRVCEACGWEEYGYGLPVPKDTQEAIYDSEDSGNSRQCFHCANNVPSEYKYCPNCGKALL